ncbi:hypothetical protein KM043_017810 [Ampulex compressa]|nr:hypothetical protein KM043_017810 [Ampulex compressa]
MGYSPGSEVGYLIRERKRVRGGWAWFVFEVESTLHLLFRRRNLFTTGGTSWNLPNRKEHPTVPAIPVSRDPSTLSIRWTGRRLVNFHVNRSRQFESALWASLRSRPVVLRF